MADLEKGGYGIDVTAWYNFSIWARWSNRAANELGFDSNATTVASDYPDLVIEPLPVQRLAARCKFEAQVNRPRLLPGIWIRP
ncbi:unnamed protein product [Protopolystoma xenopodis]|uniref:Uncharacterized protein n=1 Tax=Protopolystoma xenopodis TaxID=117903 RepID=A0A3S5CM24_9PLAT|nr:unnamed protein product [Protopolystoma xenopodis]